MSELSSHEFEKARKILWRYYDTIMEQAAEDIIRHADEFEKGTFGSADDIIDKHHCRIARLAGVYANIRSYGSKEKEPMPITPIRFRCEFPIGGSRWRRGSTIDRSV